MTDAKSQLDAGLDEFAKLGVFADRARLAPILATSGAAVAARDQRFASGLELIIGELREGATHSLEALSFAWRATSVTSMREHRKRLVERLSSGLVPREFNDLPTKLQDPDDRRHLADAMFFISADWKPQYLARAIAAEREGEKARESLCRALLHSLPILDRQIELVGEALSAEVFEQLEPETGRARRAISIVDALASAMWSSEIDVEPGERFGEEIARFVTNILLRRVSPERPVAVQFASSIVKLVVVAVRLHGSLAADAQSYTFLGPMRRAFGTGGWPDLLQEQLARASSQILDQLLLLVRLGIPDTALRGVFVSTVGEVTARMRLAAAAEREPGIDPDGAHWLVTGSARRALATHAAVSETAISTIDVDIALAYRDAELLELGFDQILPDLRTAAEFHSPALASKLSSLEHRLGRMSGAVKNAAQKRGLVLKGQPGEIVAFSPNEHEPSTEAIGQRSVRLISRSVERVVDGKTASIVLKADVDKA